MPQTSNVERSIGIILGKLEGIESQLQRQDTSRAALHKRLDDLVMRTTHLENDVLSTKNKVTDMQSVTDDVKKMATKAEGAGTAGRWLMRLGLGIVGFVGWAIGIYTWITGRPPP